MSEDALTSAVNLLNDKHNHQEPQRQPRIDQQQDKADHSHDLIHLQPFPSVHGCQFSAHMTAIASHADTPPFFAG